MLPRWSAVRLLACVALAVATLAIAPHSMAQGTADDVTAARERLSAAATALAATEKRVTTAEKSLTTAQADLASAAGVYRDAKQAAAVAHRRQLAAARVARRTAALSEAADQRAFDSRAAVMRLARDAYATSMASSDLMLLTEFITDGTASLGDVSQQSLAIERVQTRLITEAEAYARAAEAARATAHEAAVHHDQTMNDEQAADDAAARALRDLRTTKATLRNSQHELHAAQVASHQAETKYRAAQAAFKDAFLAACRAGSAAAPSAPPQSTGSRAKLVWDMLIANGFTPEATAGILGNLQQESNVDPTVTQSGGPGMGLAQWSRGGRWDNGPNSLLAFAGQRGMNPWDAKTQTQFMIFEMSAEWGGFDLASFKKMTDISKATVYFHDKYEMSADSAAFVNTIRVGFAQMWYANLSDTKPAAGGKTYVEPILSCTT